MGRYMSLEEQEEYNNIVNQSFRTEGEFYEFYNSYAACKGFSVRKGKVRRKRGSDEIIWRRFCCSNEGYRSIKSFDKTIRRGNRRDLHDFNDVHSHPFEAPQYVFVLRSHRGLSAVQEIEAIELGLGGLRTCQIMDVMEKNYGGPGETGFLLRDLYNFFARKKKKSVEGCNADRRWTMKHSAMWNELELHGKAKVSIKYTDISAHVLEKKAARIFTPPMFYKVRDQIREGSNWEVAEVTMADGVVTYEQDGENEEAVDDTSLPALFSGASRACRRNVLDPEKIIPKGAPRTNGRWTAQHESFRGN
ncbi:hypothetical protein QOZ80_5BG0419300 [Eleusine coracana subsp. coracana]|nr:hypothetical protein QOZ80_5BG0419300 [Eleusine coracana subsp. coracana]